VTIREWTDSTGTYREELDDLGVRVGLSCLSRVATAEDIAAEAVITARVAKLATLMADAETALAEVKAGSVDFGSAPRNRVVKVALKGIRFTLKGLFDD